MVQILTHELHVHLAGNLTADDLWELGRDTFGSNTWLNWYADEYARVMDTRPDPAEYWLAADGLARLRRDFEVRTPLCFAAFQAKFNLVIAILRASANDAWMEQVMTRDARSGLRYAEYRAYIPPNREDPEPELTALAQTCQRVEGETGGQFVPRFALTVARDATLFDVQYSKIKAWQRRHPELGGMLVALDFAGDEHDFPPAAHRQMLHRVHRDNDDEFALAILYHVGEMFDRHSVLTALRWIWEAAELGAHRLGHATAAGLDLAALQGRPLVLSPEEGEQHLAWLRANADALDQFGYTPESKALRQWFAAPPATYQNDLLAEAERMQGAVQEMLAERQTIVESCPTSNFRIGQITQADHHPLPHLLNAGVPVVIGADDPGIFAIRLADEAELCQEVLGIDRATLQHINQRAVHATAKHLVERP